MCRARHTQNVGEGPGLLRGLSEVPGSGKFNFLSEVLGFKSLAPQLHVLAPSKARRILQGESPCRVKSSNGFQQGLATHPYRALGPWRRYVIFIVSAGRRNIRLETSRNPEKSWILWKTHPTVGSMEIKSIEQDGLSVGRESCRPQG